jgi:hypothetical protein
MITAHDFEIATPPGALVNLGDLTEPLLSPKPEFTEFTQAIPLASGLVKGGGWSTASWKWGSITIDERDQLKTFCPTDLSAPVYIRTWRRDGTFGYYEGVMVWPENEGEHQAGRLLDFTVTFQDLQSYTPP